MVDNNTSLKNAYITKDLIQLKTINKFSSETTIVDDVAEVFNIKLNALYISDTDVIVDNKFNARVLVLTNCNCSIISNDLISISLINCKCKKLIANNLRKINLENSEVSIESNILPEVFNIKNSNVYGKGYDNYNNYLRNSRLKKTLRNLLVILCVLLVVFYSSNKIKK